MFLFVVSDMGGEMAIRYYKSMSQRKMSVRLVSSDFVQKFATDEVIRCGDRSRLNCSTLRERGAISII